MSENLAAIHERLRQHEERLDKQEVLLYGDSRIRLKGVVERIETLEIYIEELQLLIKMFETRLDTSLVFVRVGLWLVAAIATGVWWPSIRGIADALIIAVGGP